MKAQVISLLEKAWCTQSTFIKTPRVAKEGGPEALDSNLEQPLEYWT
jgi:hypothetical protein